MASISDSSTDAFTAIPVVDLGGRERSLKEQRELANKICDVCHKVGFLVVTNHGVPARVIQDVFLHSQQFFQRPRHEKKLISKLKSRHFRGWEPVGSESTNNRTDVREQIDFWTEHASRDAINVQPKYLRLLGPNQWLPESIAPGFQAAIDAWFEEMGKLANYLMRLLAMGLELDETIFDELFGEEQMSLTKLISYPKTPPGQFGVNAHHDTGFLTILSPGGPGLEIENERGEWIPVPMVQDDDALVINLGEMLQAMTGNYIVATPHRVRTDEPRLACGYFHGPSLETRLQPPLPLNAKFVQTVNNSPHHCKAGFMAQQKEIKSGIGDYQSHVIPKTYGEQLWNYFQRSYPKNMALHYPNDVSECCLE